MTGRLGNAERPDLRSRSDGIGHVRDRTDRRFAFRLRLRSVTNYGCGLPPGGHSCQAEDFPALAGYRAAPAT
jgi:hypothetical protein